MYSVTKIVEFHTAHKLINYVGPCHNIHGHSYKAHITLRSPKLNDQNMVVDFKDLKGIINSLIGDWDHCLFVYKGDTKLLEYCHSEDIKIYSCDYENTTAEIMCKIVYDYMITKLEQLNLNISVERVRIYETDTSYAEYYDERI